MNLTWPLVHDLRVHRWLSGSAWTLGCATLSIAYVAIAIYTGNPWPWLENVHETGDRTLIQTVLYFEHAARELPLDMVLGVAIGGSVLFAFPARGKPAAARGRGRRNMLLLGTVIVTGAIVLGTLRSGGIAMLIDNVLQMHTRPGEPLNWGSHWRYHFLSHVTLMLVSFGLAGLVVLISKGNTGTGDRVGLSMFSSALGVFAGLTIVFTPDLKPFTDPVFLGHQVREVFTYILVAVPLAWGVCLFLGRDDTDVCADGTISIHGSLVAGIIGVFVGLFLLISALDKSAASQGQTHSLVLLIFPHFFEHSFSYLVVALVAGASYESARVARG